MSEFVNTRDVLGDEATAAAIIDRTITEFADKDVKKVRNSAFAECKSLTKVNIPNAEQLNSSVFANCFNLERVDFYGSQGKSAFGYFGLSNYAFANCSKLATLVILGDSVCSVSGSGHWMSSTLIGKGEGYIYVPEGLVEAYKTSEWWSYYANQIKPISELPQ